MELLYLLLALFAMDVVLDERADELNLEQAVVTQKRKPVNAEPKTDNKSVARGTSSGTLEGGIFKKGHYYKSRYGYYMTNLASSECYKNTPSTAARSKPSTTEKAVIKIEWGCSNVD